jgi:hypothetical protein
MNDRQKETQENVNCLSGLRCPNCQSLGPFKIRTTCLMVWTDDGTDDYEDCEFDEDSGCHCVNCGRLGKVLDFQEDQ